MNSKQGKSKVEKIVLYIFFAYIRVRLLLIKFRIREFRYEFETPVRVELDHRQICVICFQNKNAKVE